MLTVVPKKGKRRKRQGDRAAKAVIGWREWIVLPELEVSRIKAKIDTGARSSAMHAWNIVPFERNGRLWVRFEVHPLQRNNRESRICEAPVVDHRRVKSSSGHDEERYVIKSDLEISGQVFSIEISLTNRDQMGFRLLLGRTAMRNRFVVDPGRSFLFGK